MPSPFAADRSPDGRRHYSHRAVVARRTLLGGIVVAGAGAVVGVRHLTSGGGDDAGDDLVTTAAAGTAAPVTAAPEPTGPPLHSTTDAASPWVVVNKQHPLTPADYAPAELGTVAGKEVAAVVVPDLQDLLAAAGDAGVGLTLTSGFRSLQYQRSVHDRAVERDGFEVAESLSARPGYSEHQTGLAVDFGSRSRPECAVQDCYRFTPEAAWLAENAGGFGFLLRYPEDLTAVTGYAPESWHYRWVGRELTGELAARGVGTLEEFFGVTGGPEYA